MFFCQKENFLSFFYVKIKSFSMKKFGLLVFSALFLSMMAQSQPYTVSVTYQHTFTKPQVDSVMISILGSQLGNLAIGAIGTNYTVKLYKVIYNTYGPDSVPTTASGLLAVPQGTPCEVPILSFQHNNIIRKSDAPSRYGDNSQWYIGMAAGSLGYISLMPDGIGLGSGPGQHPFLQLQSEATPVIDMIRAVKEFVDTTGNSPTEQLFLAGVAEGAYASVAAHQYIQTYLDTLMHVAATGGIAGNYDMSGTMINQILSDSNYVDPSYLPELMLSYNRTYNIYPNDSDFMVYPYDSMLPPLFNGNYTQYYIDGYVPSVAKTILQQDVIDSLQSDSTYIVRQLFSQNDVYNWAPTSPVYLMYCIDDEYVPYQNSIVAYNHFVQNGATMIDTFDINPAYDHEECGEFSVISAVSLIKALTHQPIVSRISATSSTSPTAPNGTATVSDTLGDPPYTWSWSNGDSTAIITGLAAGTYYVTTTDRAHCTSIDSVVVQLNDGLNELTLANINVYPNPTQGMLMIQNGNVSEVLTQIEITDMNGNAVNASQSQNGNITSLNLGEEAKGVYFLTIQSQSGKELHRKIVLL